MKFKDLELKIAAGVATESDFAQFAAADVHRIKAELPFQCRGRIQAAELEAVLTEAEAATRAPGDAFVEPGSRQDRTRTLIFNVQLPDRMGDIVIANPADAAQYSGSGYQTQHWMAAGAPYLWCHDPQEGGAVGRVTNPRAQKVKATLADGKVKNAWAFVGDTEFLADERMAHAMESWAMVQAGFTASSIGFMPKVTVHIDDEDERKRLGLGRWGALFAEVEIYEVSHVLIPANPWSIELDRANAKTVEAVLQKMVGDGRMKGDRAAALMARLARPAAPAWMAVGQRVKGLVAASGRDCEGLECVAGQERVQLTEAEAMARAIDVQILQGVQAEQDFVNPELLTVLMKVGTKDPAGMLARIRTPAVQAAIFKAMAQPGATADGSCGCGAKAKDAELVRLRARVAELEALPEIRSADAVRAAMDRASETVELLSVALDGEPADEFSTEGLVSESEAATLDADLQIVRADTTLLRVLGPLVHALVEMVSPPRALRTPAPHAPEAIRKDDPVAAERVVAEMLAATAADLRTARTGSPPRTT